MEVRGDRTPALAGDFDPPAPLGDPPAPDPKTDGLAYLRKVYPPLRQAWGTFLDDCRLRLAPSHPLNNDRLAVSVELIVERGGRLAKAEIASPSGNPSFDQAALEVVRDAAPFPAPPADVLSDDDLVHLTWLFARDRRQAGLATAELHRVRWAPERVVPKLLAGRRTGAAARRIADEAADLSGESGAEIESLVRLLRETAAASVAEALAGKDDDVKLLAVEAVSAGRLTWAVGDLRRLAEGAAHLELRRAAVRTLGELQDRTAIPLLVEYLTGARGSAPADRAAAAGALVALGEKDRVLAALEGGLDAEEKAARQAALAILAQVPAPAEVPRLAALLVGRPEASRAERLAAAAALGTAGADTAIAALARGLEVRDAAVRAACVQALAEAAGGGARSRHAFWKVARRLEDRDERVRAGAVLAAARLDPERFARQLRRLQKERSAAVLAALAGALSAVPGNAALGRLEELARHPDPQVRRRAAASLKLRPEPASREVLAQLVSDADLEVRRLALLGIRDVELLAETLADQAPQVRAAALSGLVRVRGRSSILGQAARMMADAEAASAERVHLARAWLAP